METLNFDIAASLRPGIPYCYDNMNKDFVVDPSPVHPTVPKNPIHFKVSFSTGLACREAVSLVEKVSNNLSDIILSLIRDGRIFASCCLDRFNGFQFLVVLPAQEMAVSTLDGTEVYIWNRESGPVTLQRKDVLFAEFPNRDSFAGSSDVEAFENEIYNIISELLTTLVYRHLVAVGFREETAREPKVRWYWG